MLLAKYVLLRARNKHGERLNKKETNLILVVKLGVLAMVTQRECPL